MKFSQFAVGQYVAFTRAFSSEDYEKFRAVSADNNPLHWDVDYAREAGFSQPILPLGLSISPFSAIAGKALPGIPSLILSSSWNAHSHVDYDQNLTWSARVSHILTEKRVLQLDLRVYDGERRLISGKMSVQARVEEWNIPDDIAAEFRVREPARVALVTGAEGAIGAACAARLESAGWQVLRHARRSNTADIVADLATEAGREQLSHAVREHQPTLIVHAASAATKATLTTLIATNYLALHSLTAAALPHMLAMQRGRIVNVGSVAQLKVSGSFTDYAAAKTLSDWYLNQVDLQHRSNGVETTTVLCDKTNSAFSEGQQALSGTAMEPEEVAEQLVALGLGEQPLHTRYTLSSEGLTRLTADEAPQTVSNNSIPTAKPERVAASFSSAPLEELRTRLRTMFNQLLPDSVGKPDNLLRINTLSGWDSMTQIAIALEVEQQFGIALNGAAVAELISFDALLQAISNAKD